uniref:Uncharacterized protein n=1 Tax=viral metagenome TaxID=1070528 RepID=A0A6C0DQ90_9ZZZZ
MAAKRTKIAEVGLKYNAVKNAAPKSAFTIVSILRFPIDVYTLNIIKSMTTAKPINVRMERSIFYYSSDSFQTNLLSFV